jgi:4-carboxymuconolactone decarboxylase
MPADRAPAYRPGAERIPRVVRAGAGTRETLANTMHDSNGEPLPIFQLLAHNEPLLRRFNSLGALMRTSTVTDLRHREVIVLRVAYRTDCPFEYNQHIGVAREVGVSEGTIRRATGQSSSSEASIEDSVLLAIADEILDDDCVSARTWEAARQLWDHAQLIELVMCAGFFRMTAAVINSIGLRPQESSGDADGQRRFDEAPGGLHRTGQHGRPDGEEPGQGWL